MLNFMQQGTKIMSQVYFKIQNILLGHSDQKAWNANICCSVRFEVFTAVTVKNGVLWGVTPCDSCKNRRFRGT
jgi:hypothetical protein